MFQKQKYTTGWPTPKDGKEMRGISYIDDENDRSSKLIQTREAVNVGAKRTFIRSSVWFSEKREGYKKLQAVMRFLLFFPKTKMTGLAVGTLICCPLNALL